MLKFETQFEKRAVENMIDLEMCVENLFPIFEINPIFLLFVQRNGTAILENVSLEGAELPGCQGRLQNPGE